VVGNVEDGALVESRVGDWGVVNAGRESVVEVSLPEANVDVQGGCKGGDLHVVGPLARLSHFLEVEVELLLELLFGVEGEVDGRGQLGVGFTLGVAADGVDDHVLAVELGVDPHVCNCRVAEGLVLTLVAVELV
jgi:hypothetical protein